MGEMGGGFTPLRTERLLIRPMRVDDAAVVAAYRNHPDVARYQDWPVPYTEQTYFERFATRDGEVDLAAGTNLGIEVGGELVGDLYVQLANGIAEIGWTLSPGGQGRGVATEAAAALVEELFTALGAHRVHAGMHPENVASMRVCEAIGMTYESHTRLTFQGRDGWEDDLHFAMLRDDWQAWVTRDRTPPDDVTLVEITPDDAYLWGRVVTHYSQEEYVSPVLKSFRDALFPEVVDGAPLVPWIRGVLADGERAAFVMTAEVTDAHPEPYLWRLLVDRMHQRRGIGERVMAQLVDRYRAEGHAGLLTSWGEGPGGPRPFYERLGFVPTGRIVDEETEARLSL